MHFKGSQLLNPVVKILLFRDGLYLTASLFTCGVITVTLSIRCHCTGKRTHAISQEFSSKYYRWLFWRWNDRYFFMNYTKWVETSDLYFIRLKTLKCFRSLIPVSYKYHRDKLHMCVWAKCRGVAGKTDARDSILSPIAHSVFIK